MRLSAVGSKKVQGVPVFVLLGKIKELKKRAIPLPSVVLSTVAPVAKQSRPPLRAALGPEALSLPPPHAVRIALNAITVSNLYGVEYLCIFNSLLGQEQSR